MRKMYFFGVTTAASGIHRLFPRWTRLAGVEDATLVGVDLPLDGQPERYRDAVRVLLDDPQASGALVTSHKVQVWTHARDLFTGFDADAEMLGEVGCMVRRGARLTGSAIDTLTSGLALREFLPETPFRGHALILGAGGAGTALACHLFRDHSPAQVTLTDTVPARLELVRRLTPALVASPEQNDRLLESLPDGGLVVNATGLGKDRPGSPISDHAGFPPNTIAWDFNYRGELRFLDQARAQGARAVDGWNYFLHGWSQIMARVLGFTLTEELFAALRQAAALR